MTSENLGHGHVRPRADGRRFACGGPGRCPVCIAEEEADAPPAPPPVEPPEDVDKIVAAREALLGRGWVLPPS